MHRHARRWSPAASPRRAHTPREMIYFDGGHTPGTACNLKRNGLSSHDGALAGVSVCCAAQTRAWGTSPSEPPAIDTGAARGGRRASQGARVGRRKVSFSIHVLGIPSRDKERKSPKKCRVYLYCTRNGRRHVRKVLTNNLGTFTQYYTLSVDCSRVAFRAFGPCTLGSLFMHMYTRKASEQRRPLALL